MRINDDILRYMTLRVEEHDDEPSAMMKKGDRDDRPKRDGGREERPRRSESPRSDEHSEAGE